MRNLNIVVSNYVIGNNMNRRITISLREEEIEFLRDNPEISPSGLMKKAIKEYKSKMKV